MITINIEAKDTIELVGILKSLLKNCIYEQVNHEQAPKWEACEEAPRRKRKSGKRKWNIEEDKLIIEEWDKHHVRWFVRNLKRSEYAIYARRSLLKRNKITPTI